MTDTAKALELNTEETWGFRMYEREMDYPTAHKWWEAHNAVALDSRLLPDSGVVYLKKGTPVAMTWVFLSNSSAAQISWTVCDPKLGPREKVRAVQGVIMAAEEFAKSFGVKWLMTFSDRPALSKIFMGREWTLMTPHQMLTKSFEEEKGEIDPLQ